MATEHQTPRRSYLLSRRQALGLAIGTSLLLACPTLAAPALADDQFVLKCTGPTPSTNPSNYPGTGRIILSNNLVRPAGKSLDAPGQMLYLSGRLTDENCVPIANAIIDLWQANPFGTYRTASRNELLTPDPVFAGNGRAVTDNMGRYQFTTLFPGEYGRNAPHINLRVSHPDFDTLNTTLYFRGDQRNDADSRLRAMKQEQRDRLLADVNARPESLSATFNIVVKGRHTFRRY